MTNSLTIDDIELRRFSENQAEMLFNLINKNREHIGKWLSWVPTTTKIEQIRNKILQWTEREKKTEEKTFGIWYKNTLVGVISLMWINKEDNYAEIGYWLDETHQGKGIVTKSCRLIINYGFKELGLHRIEISCATENAKSCAIPERLGFTKEGTSRESGLINGKYVDHHWYSLLENEWNK